jgi:D-galactonate transporter
MSSTTLANPYASNAPPRTEEEVTYRTILWRLLPLLVVCYTVAYLDRVNIGFAKMQMMSDLKLSDTIYGLGAGIFFLGYVLAEVPSNIILHRVGARAWIARILVTWGIVSACMMFVQSETSFYALRFLLGVAEAGFFPGIIYFLMQWFPASRRARVLSIFYIATPLSGVIGAPLSGWIIQGMAGVGPLTGWQWMFLIEAIPAVLLGVVVFRYLPDRIVDAKWLTEKQKAIAVQRLSAENATKEKMPMSAVFFNLRVWQLSAILFMIVMALYGVFFWMPTLVSESGVKSPLYVGLLSAIPYLVAIPVMVLVGRHSDRTGERRIHMVVLCILGMTGILLSVLWQHQTYLLLAAMTLATAAVMTILPLFWTMPTAVLEGGAAAAGIALINSLGVTAGFVAPYMVGFLRDLTKSNNAAMCVLAALWVVGAVLIWTFPKKATVLNAAKA